MQATDSHCSPCKPLACHCKPHVVASSVSQCIEQFVAELVGQTQPATVESVAALKHRCLGAIEKLPGLDCLPAARQVTITDGREQVDLKIKSYQQETSTTNHCNLRMQFGS
eukprot:15439040-Alexandrium_andersonii.AAC.1